MGNKTKKILLVYPEIPRATYWSFSTALDLLNKKANMPPLGLLTIASMFPKDHQIKLIDLNVESLKDDDIFWADFVFVSAMIVQKESFFNLVQKIKGFNKTIIAGGPYISSCYEDVENVDHFVIGEAENVFNDFLKDFENGTLKKAYAKPVRETEFKKLKTFFGEDSKIDLQTSYPDINTSPLPKFELLKKPDIYQSMAVQTSRGCPVGCEFCDIWRRFGRKPRFKTFQNLKNEFDSLYSLGWRGSVFIVDDNFIGNKSYTKKLLKDIAAWQKEKGYPFELYTEVTLTLADDDELLGLMRDAGFDYVFMGIETPSQESLKETKKYINTVGSIADKVARIQNYGMQVSSGFIIGFDSDPENISDMMINCIQNLGIPMAMVGLLQPLPDTDLTDRLAKEGRLIKKSTGNNTHEFSLHFKTKRPMKSVINDYKKVLMNIYSQNLKSYFERCKTLRKRYVHNPNLSQKTKFVHIKALFRFLWRSIFKSYRFTCWKFLAGTLFTNPKFFSMACALAVQGHHFREITKLAFEMDKLENYFSELLKHVVGKLRKEMEAGRNLSEQKMEQISSIIENYKKELNLYFQPKLKRLSKKYGIPLERTYQSFLARLEAEFEKLAVEYYSRMEAMA